MVLFVVIIGFIDISVGAIRYYVGDALRLKDILTMVISR